MGSSTHTHWGMTINNYDETDLALVQQGYPDHIRQLVYTLERGAEGTPHIQAFIKMKRDCRLSHMKKLFPRGHFKFLDSSEYRLNAQRYAQKLDDTAESPATITNGDPLHTLEGTVRTIALAMVEWYATEGNESSEEWETVRKVCEMDSVKKDYTMAKVFVSSTYKQMWKEFGHEMFENIFHTHTHTHTHTKSFVDAETQTDSDDVQEAHCPLWQGGSEDDYQGSDSGSDGSSGEERSDGSSETDGEA